MESSKDSQSSLNQFIWDSHYQFYNSEGSYASKEDAINGAIRFAQEKGLDKKLGMETLIKNIIPNEIGDKSHPQQGRWKVSFSIPPELAPTTDITSKIASSTLNLTKEMPLDPFIVTSGFFDVEEISALILSKNLDTHIIRDNKIDNATVELFKKKSSEIETLKNETIASLESCLSMLDQIVIPGPDIFDADEAIATLLKIENVRQFLIEKIQELQTLNPNIPTPLEGDSSFKIFENAFYIYQVKKDFLNSTMEDLTAAIALTTPRGEILATSSRQGKPYDFILGQFFIHLLKNGFTQMGFNLLDIYVKAKENREANIINLKVKMIEEYFSTQRVELQSNNNQTRFISLNAIIKILNNLPSDISPMMWFDKINPKLWFDKSVAYMCDIPLKNVDQELPLEELNKIKQIVINLRTPSEVMQKVLQDLIQTFAFYNPPQMKSVDELIILYREMCESKSDDWLSVPDKLLQRLKRDFATFIKNRLIIALRSKYEEPALALKESLSSSMSNPNLSRAKAAYQRALDQLQKNLDVMKGFQNLDDKILTEDGTFEGNLKGFDALKSTDSIKRELLQDLMTAYSEKEFIDQFPNILTEHISEGYSPKIFGLIPLVASKGEKIELKRNLFIKLADVLPTINPSIKMFIYILDEAKKMDEFSAADLKLIEEAVAHSFEKHLGDRLKGRNNDCSNFNELYEAMANSKIKAELSILWIEHASKILREKLDTIDQRDISLMISATFNLLNTAQNIPMQFQDHRRGNWHDYAVNITQPLASLAKQKII